LLPASAREAAAELDTVLSELVLNSVEIMDEPRTEDSLVGANVFNEDEPQNPNLAAIKHMFESWRASHA
jgi:hypothetical protein